MPTKAAQRVRCAIYTRKSTEEGLDQAFNSLDAQQEACEAFIKSQTHEGWKLVPTRYDDGGYSGGTLERPALQRLLTDIEANKVEIVVVYKVDRLTRSLADFAKIVEIFDASDVSFASVTQAFNTTTSMGRLTLNMLLSFAQFEREVTGERIRDKIAASKKKGMWMGGVVPLGYDVVDRKLIVNAAEAETVRTLFRLYLEHGNVRLVKEEADRLGLRTKARKPNNGKRQGGEPFTRGHIYKVLTNPLYVGKMPHKGELHQGEHEAIIPLETWEAVQGQLQHNAVRRHRNNNSSTQSLLTGLLFDEDGERLAPTYATKSGRRYRYYVSASLNGHSAARGAGWRLPAPAIEKVVLGEICRLLRDKHRLVEVLGSNQSDPSRLGATLSGASRLADRIHGLERPDQRTFLLDIVNRIEVRSASVRIGLRTGQLRTILEAGQDQPNESVDGELVLDIPVRFKRRGVEMKLVIVRDQGPAAAPDQFLIVLITQAHDWMNQLRSGKVPSARHLARRDGIDPGDVSRILPLAFLAPDIVEAILGGRQPIDLTATRLKRLPHLPLAWAEQRHLLGFT